MFFDPSSTPLPKTIFDALAAAKLFLAFANRATVPSQNLFGKTLAAPAQQIDYSPHEFMPITAPEP